MDGAIASAREALAIMNYGQARFVLACALYTRWAKEKQDPAQAEAAEVYFNEAFSIFNDLDRVIQETEGYDYTSVTAAALTQWKVDNLSM